MAAPVAGPAWAKGSEPILWLDDLVAALLSALVISGLFLDGWNHLNLLKGKLGSFFTPWHGLLYAGFTANAIWIARENQHLWRKDIEPDPHLFRIGRLRLRYPYAVGGLVLVFVGMVGDLIWHTVLGEETNVARVIAPFHIILFTGAALLIAAPLRSAWHAPAEYPRRSSFVRLLPALISLTLMTAAASFMLQWMSPFMEWHATSLDLFAGIVPTTGPGLQTAMAARVVLANIIFVGPLLLTMRRWTLPPGAATLVFGVVATAMSALTSFDLAGTIVAAVVGGMAVDGVVWLSRRFTVSVQMFLVAAAAPIACWPLYFVIVNAGYGANWPTDFFLGVVSFSTLVGLVLAFFAGLPVPPDDDIVDPAPPALTAAV
jgi:hypothetical protein